MEREREAQQQRHQVDSVWGVPPQAEDKDAAPQEDSIPSTTAANTGNRHEYTSSDEEGGGADPDSGLLPNTVEEERDRGESLGRSVTSQSTHTRDRDRGEMGQASSEASSDTGRDTQRGGGLSRASSSDPVTPFQEQPGPRG